MGTTAWRWYDREPGEGLKALSPDEHDFVQAIAEAWMPHGGEPALSGAEARLGAFFDDIVAGMEPATGVEFKLLLQALDDLPMLTHLRPFRLLELDARIEVLDGWLHSDFALIRVAALGVLALAGAGWTTHPEVVPFFRPLFRCGYGR